MLGNRIRIFFVYIITSFFIFPIFCNAKGVTCLWEKDLFDEETAEYSPEATTVLSIAIDTLSCKTYPNIICGVDHFRSNRIFSLRGSDGLVNWEKDLGGGFAYSLSSIIDEKAEEIRKVVVGTYDGLINIFNLRTGELMEEIDHLNKIRGIASFDINSDGITDYAVVGDWLHMAVYDGKTHKKLWVYNSEKHMEIIIIDDINQDGSHEIIGSYNGNQVLVMDAVTGETKWAADLGTASAMMGMFTGPNSASTFGVTDINDKRALVVGTINGDLLLLDGKTGVKIIENKEMIGYPTCLSIGDLNGDNIFDLAISSTDHKVYGLRGADLEKEWEFKTGDEVYSSPALGDMDNDGLLDVVVVSDDDWVYCIDGEKGELIWKYDIGADCQASNALIADVNSNGFVDVVLEGALHGGKLTVLETDARCERGKIMWPKVFGNNRNTREYGVK